MAFLNFNTLDARISSFAKAPSLLYRRSLALATSGFYFTRHETLVQCTCCKQSVLYDRTMGNPHIVHQKLSPKCPFVMKASQKLRPLSQLSHEYTTEISACHYFQAVYRFQHHMLFPLDNMLYALADDVENSYFENVS